MIIVDLIGGIGNQLFQYSAGRQLSLVKNTGLKLNITAFESYKLHKYSLQHFNIKATIASEQDLTNIRYIYQETSFNFDPELKDIPIDTRIKGYWQSERYFSDIEDVLRQDLQINLPITGINEELAELIRATNSISLHIRRGDYISNNDTYNYHGICDLSYYRKCIALIADNIVNPHFFIFSDDAEWAKENLKTGHDTTFITHNNAETNYEDLRLMALCEHNIIANSTFSWWGAWLNENPQKVVLAPAAWFNNSELNIVDLLPRYWIKIL